ncbi:hypothetical protein RIF29_35783 [Crotalaria pallida]|uniref:Kinesin motor domain-containing protein n=1 Tax=Crotalaria pallida TaxID=3830 RepID=A0AAN9ECW4_CROPI
MTKKMKMMMTSKRMKKKAEKKADTWICYCCGSNVGAKLHDKGQSSCQSHSQQKDRAWTMQVLALTCLSMAAKIDETQAPMPIDLQNGANAVTDLLGAQATPLRVLDDPEKGTVVKKLTEETLKDKNKLLQLLFTCAAERTMEETAMNEISFRSHQILRLTAESNPNDHIRTARSGTLIASVRASQSLSASTRLREGSHINRNLLTLGIVIWKLRLRVQMSMLLYCPCSKVFFWIHKISIHYKAEASSNSSKKHH